MEGIVFGLMWCSEMDGAAYKTSDPDDHCLCGGLRCWVCTLPSTGVGWALGILFGVVLKWTGCKHDSYIPIDGCWVGVGGRRGRLGP
eukprot:gene10664-biopygen15683